MKATTSGYKTILANKGARTHLIKIDLTLANNTVLHLTGEDIWQDSFSIDTASSGTSSFDIGCAIIGKCTFTLNNIDGDFDNYDFFNATAVVWLGLVGDTVNNVQQYYKMGTFTVDEPSTACGLISLTLLDYMWKLDRPLPTLSLPNTAINVINSLCSHCGVVLGTQNFHGSSFSVPDFEDKNEMNCRELLQYIAMIGCNFCTMNADGQLIIKWYNTSATSATTATFDLNQNVTLGTEDIEITGVKIVINDTAHTVGSSGYVLEIENPLINTTNVNTALNLIWDVLEDFTLRTFNITTASDLSVEIGDKCKIKDYQGNYTYSWVTTNNFKLAGHNVQCSAEPPSRTLVTRYSKTVQTAVAEARKKTAEQISTYDQVVQLMNELAVNAMGGYEDYEDVQTGGRIWYWSNMPITKSGGTCSFESGSVVFKKTGTGLFVSTNGGSTWGNAYDAETGELVINMLYAIGIHADWIRTGTLLVGGSHTNPANADIQVYDDNDDLICTINKDGITMHQGIISSPDYDEDEYATYSTTGMKLDVLNKVLRSPYFAIDEYGANFKGEILITGDFELRRGSFKFVPAEYGISDEFYLELYVPDSFSGSATYEIIETDGTSSSLEASGTLSSSNRSDTVSLDPLTRPSEYYQITCSDNAIRCRITEATLAYVGRDGFKGNLVGSVDGTVTSSYGRIAGFYYGVDADGKPLPSNTLLLKDNGGGDEFRIGYSGFGATVNSRDSSISFDDGLVVVGGDGNGASCVLRVAGSGSHDVFFENNVSHGFTIKRSYPDSSNPGYYLTDEVVWDDGDVMKYSAVQTSTTDSPPQSLADGHLFLVYE